MARLNDRLFLGKFAVAFARLSEQAVSNGADNQDDRKKFNS